MTSLTNISIGTNLLERQRIKHRTIQHRRLIHHQDAVYLTPRWAGCSLSQPAYWSQIIRRQDMVNESQVRELAMPKRGSNDEVTSRRSASAAAMVLRHPKSSKIAKTAAASALAQRSNRK